MKRPIQIMFFLTLALSIFAVTAFAADRWVPVPDRISKDYISEKESLIMPEKELLSRENEIKELDPRVKYEDDKEGLNPFARPLGEGSSVETAPPPPEEEPQEAQCPIGPDYYECACQNKWIDEANITGSGIPQRIDEIVSSNNELYKVGETFLICFNFSDAKELRESIAINNTNASSILYNLKVLSLDETASITLDSNIKLVAAEISGQALTPLIIRGSNVTIDGLELTSSYRGSGAFRGIKIEGESEDNKIRNIEIVDSSISGAGKFYEDSIGIEIINAEGVTITDNPNSIEKVETGVKGAASVIRTSFKNVVTPIDNPSPVVDVSKVGKHIDLESNTVDRLVGVSPLQNCIADNFSASVDLYLFKESGTLIHHEQICQIVPLSEESNMCLYYGNHDTLPETSEELQECIAVGNCECLSTNTCIFDCSSIKIETDSRIGFSVSSDNQSHNISEAMMLELPDLLGSIVATMAPTVPSSAGPAGLTEEPDRIKESGSGDETPSDGTSATNTPEGGDIVGDGLAPLGGGLAGGLTKGGCSLTANNNIFTPAPFALVFMVLLSLGLPVVVRVRNKK